LKFILLTIGGAICGLNFYLSFLRARLLIARGAAADSIRHVSGFPWIGSALVAIAWLSGLDSVLLSVLAGLLILIDTGGIHWFLIIMLRQAWVARVR